MVKFWTTSYVDHMRKTQFYYRISLRCCYCGCLLPTLKCSHTLLREIHKPKRVLFTFINCFSVTPGSVSSKKLALIEQDPGKRMGNWEKLVHPVARRAYFVNKDTGQASWTTPAEVQP